MTQEEALEILDDALGTISQLRGGRPGSPEHVEFVQTTGLELARILGPSSAATKNFAAIKYEAVGNFVANPLNLDYELAKRRLVSYERGLDYAEGIVRGARKQLTRHGADNILRGSRLRSEGPTVFISHGLESPALAKIERYLRAIGAQPLMVGREPSEGMAVDDLVRRRLGESDCAIILATADEEVDGRLQPRPNVLHEIGLAQEVLSDDVIYLKEQHCEFPSNVSPKVWENFTQDNLESAFEKIAKELRAFGLL